MNKLVLLGAICLAEINLSIAQSGYEHVYGGNQADWFRNVLPTSDGGAIACGATRSFGFGNINNYDGYVVKTNHDGDTLWERHFGTVNLEEAYKIIENSQGYLVVGFNVSSLGLYKAYAVQYDVNGNQVWENFYGGAATEYGLGAVAGDSAQTIICGLTNSFTNGGLDMYAVKIDSNGNQLSFAHYGSAGNENANAVIRTADGGYAFLGYSTSVDPNYDIYLVKTDGNLNFLWDRDFGGPLEDIGNDLTEDSSGNLWLLGYETASPDSSYMVLIRTDADGNNSVTYHPGTHAGDLGNSIHYAKGGGFLIGGVTNIFGKGSEMLLERLDSNGDTVWTRHFGGTQSEFGFGVAAGDSGNIYLAGETEGFGTNQFDAYLVKTDSAGTIPCPDSLSFNSSSGEICEDENVFFTNTTISSQNFSWSIDGNNFSNDVDAGYYFNQPGNHTVELSTCSVSASQNVTVNAKPATHFTYTISGDLVNFTLDPGLNVQSISWNFGDGSSQDTLNQNPAHLYPTNGLYWVVVKVTNIYGCDSTYSEQLEIPTLVEPIALNKISLFPNPANSEIEIQGVLLTEVEKIEIMNEAGLVQNVLVPYGNEVKLTVNDLDPGIYFVKLDLISGGSLREKIEVYYH